MPIDIDRFDPARKLPRDADSDNRIYEGTPYERDAPPKQEPPPVDKPLSTPGLPTGLNHLATSPVIPSPSTPPGLPTGLNHLATSPVAPPPPAPPPAKLRRLDDPAATRTALYQNVLDAAAQIAPVTNPRHTLRLANVAYEGPAEHSIADQKKAILEGRSLGRRLKGTYDLVDTETGAVLDSKRTTVATVPYITPRGTFIHNGNEYTLSHQLRLRPGVYTRRKANGEIESHVNVTPGTGASFRVHLEPETGRLKLQVGQALLPLSSALRAMGVRDEEIRAAWGNDLAAANLKEDDGAALDKLYARFVRKGDPDADPQSRRDAVAAAFASFPLDPEVNRRTLGQPFDNAGKETLMATARKLIALNRGEAEPDDRDHLAYMTVHGPEDLIAERLKNVRGTLGTSLWRASRTGSLRGVHPDALTKLITAAITSSGLGQPLESVNAGHIFDQQGRISRMGEGGIPSADSIPDESRAVQPSHLGFVDILATPESGQVGVDSRLARGVLKGADGQLYAQFKNVKTGKVEWRTPRDLADVVIAFPGELGRSAQRAEAYRQKGDWLSAQYADQDRNVAVMIGGKTKYVDRGTVDYELPHFEDAFSPMVNTVPLKSATKGQRVAMGARMQTQALPLYNAEAPHVQTGVPGSQDQSYEALYGEQLGALKSQVAGTVESVNQDGIVVRDGSGKRHRIDLYRDFAYNRKTGLHQTPVVRPGQSVAPGDLLAHSNYTDKQGTAALGMNLHSAYLAYEGHNFEDANVISQSAADKLLSEHYYQHYKEAEEGLKVHKGHYVGVFPDKYTRQQLDQVDDDGAIKVGSIVHEGDPLVLAAKPRVRLHSAIHQGRGGSFSDASETWEHHRPGVVTDVSKTAKGMNVVVKAYMPMEVGDKLSGRFGDKGVISKIVPDDEMPIDQDGRPFEALLNPLGIISRTNPSQMIEAALGKIAAKTGKPYRVQDFRDIEDLTEYAQQELAKHGLTDTETVTDPKTGRKIPGIFTGSRFFMKLHHQAESKGQGRGLAAYTAEGTPAKGGETGSKRVSLMDLNAILSHGACFMGSANVLTEQGWLEISKIVRNRMKIKVACADPSTGKVMYRPVVDWLCRCVPSSELMILETCARSGNDATHANSRPIRVTRGHEFYTPEGKVQAYRLKPGSVVYTIGTKLEPWQEQFVGGTLMGDGYAGNRRDGDRAVKSAGLASVHGYAQRDYLDWKYSKLANVVLSAPKTQKLSRGGFAKLPTSRFTTRQHPQISAIASEFYADDDKRPPVGIVARIGWLGIGVWFGDDGGCVRSKLTDKISAFRFHTNAFTIADVNRLADEMREFTGLPWRRYLQNGKYPILTLGSGDGTCLTKWAALLRPYLPPQFAHKLGVKSCGSAWRGLKPPSGEFLEETTIKSIRPYKPKPYEDNLVYNITVQEHHNYVVQGVLVGNTAVVHDAGTVRGQQHADYWQQFQSGHTPAAPEVPLVYHKFLASLRAAGINPVREGTATHVMALTDDDVDQLSEGRTLGNAETVDWKGRLAPVKGGLFDEDLTGGHGGNKWAHIPLAEPMPSPVMEDPIRRVLGLTEKQFRGVLAGREPYKGKTGPHAIVHALDAIDLPRAVAQTRLQTQSARKGERDDAVRRLKYLKGALDTGVHPRQWVLTKAPVLPPIFRPVSALGASGLPMVSDPNLLYRELFDANKNLAEMKGQVADLGEEREALYDAFKGVVGLGDPLTPRNQERQVKGVLKHVFGGSPKHGVVQRKLLSSTTDLVGRAAITPDPDLDMDQVGIPADRAWEVYRPFIVRRLVRKGMAAAQAVKAVESRDRLALAALTDEMDERPVIINRAPVLHRYGMMAFRPRLTHGSTLRVPPLIVKGFGADFDGDAMQYHVPVTDEAVRDALTKMLPSRNLLAVSSFKAHQLPANEYAGGLYEATSRRDDKSRPRTFATTEDAVRSWHKGEIEVGTPVNVVNP